jgi:plasmid maintenance system antidote protein VapI
MAELLRQQQMSTMGLERADFAQALGSSRALLAPELAQQAEAAQNEAARRERLFGAAVSAIGSGASAAFSPTTGKP